MQVGAHIVVKGMVQGVGFRYFVLRHALNLGVSGFVKNMFNGEVEIEANGERSAIEGLIKELKVGPRAAHVTDLKIEWKQFDNSAGPFEVR